MLDKASKVANVTDAITAEMAEITQAAMAPWRPGDKVKGALLRAHRELGISFRRARSFYYREPVAVLAHEADRLRAWHGDWCRREIERHKREIEELQARDTALGERLHALAIARAGVPLGRREAAVGSQLVCEAS